MSSPVSARLDAWLDARSRRRLGRHIDAALLAARATGSSTLASVTTRTPRCVDPLSVVAGSRRPGESWFSLEQPERDGTALAALGCVRELRSDDGSARFSGLALDWRELVARAVADPAAEAPGSGLVALGGFAFAGGGNRAPCWSDFPAASLVVPELSLARRANRSWLTLNLAAEPDDTREELAERAERAIDRLRAQALPLLDPAQTGLPTVSSVMAPAHYEAAVARAVERIRAGELEKVVLAREVHVHAAVPYDPFALLGVLRAEFPGCLNFGVGRGDSTFLGASPELLIRRDGARASTVALAGTTRRSADPAVDAHLGEQLLRSAKDREENEVVARRIARVLEPVSVWVTTATEPRLVQVANVQHLGTPIRAQLARPLSIIELAGRLHPTPAVGAEPRALAEQLIPALEGIDRGWYAGPVGWTDASGDGEFCVALRCALVRGARARVFAGAGIVRDSDPAAELAETELKLQAMLPLLTA